MKDLKNGGWMVMPKYISCTYVYEQEKERKIETREKSLKTASVYSSNESVSMSERRRKKRYKKCIGVALVR